MFDGLVGGVEEVIVPGLRLVVLGEGLERDLGVWHLKSFGDFGLFGVALLVMMSKVLGAEAAWQVVE